MRAIFETDARLPRLQSSNEQSDSSWPCRGLLSFCFMFYIHKLYVPHRRPILVASSYRTAEEQTMGSDRELDAMADSCIKAAYLVKEHGSPELESAMQVVLFILGQELAQRSTSQVIAGRRVAATKRSGRATQ